MSFLDLPVSPVIPPHTGVTDMCYVCSIRVFSGDLKTFLHSVWLATYPSRQIPGTLVSLGKRMSLVLFILTPQSIHLMCLFKVFVPHLVSIQPLPRKYFCFTQSPFLTNSMYYFIQIMGEMVTNFESPNLIKQQVKDIMEKRKETLP